MNSPSSHIKIQGQVIGKGHAPYVIAEMSANHNGDIGKAMRLIEAAQSSGANAVKLQTYTPDTITLNSDAEDFQIHGGLWDGRTLYELYQEAHMPWEWHKPLFEYAQKVGITIFSSPFDTTAVDLLEDLNTPAYKIASFEVLDIPLIKYVAATKKPMIISTGMANQTEIQEAVDAALGSGCRELALLYCVSGYPAPASDYKLRTLQDMAERYGCVIGLSDHTLDNITAITSVALGSCIIEKHFTLDRNGGGPDDSFSLEPDDLKALCDNVRNAWQCLGDPDYSCQSSESANVKFRRSLYFVKDLNVGDLITSDAVRSVRPGYGLAPKYLTDVIGQRVTTQVAKNSPVVWTALSKSNYTI